MPTKTTDPGSEGAVGAVGAAVGSEPAAGTDATGHALSLWTPDRLAVAVLVILPLLFFVVPALLGRPALTGDNLIQNFPLRVLTGRQLREGHLPLWNPYIWSGSPLLGGLNAGSFYPFTFVFAVLAPVAAFVVNLLGVYWAGGLGMYALLRQYRLRPLASFLGSITYAFSGAMSAQLVHLGVVQGMGWMPLLVLAELRLSWAVFGTRPTQGGEGARTGVTARCPPWPWVALLALVVGLEALTGEPRAIAETEVVGTVVAAWLVLRPYAATRVQFVRRVRYLGLLVLAGVWGVALAAAELAPGWTFIKASQRAVESYQFFSAGSLRPSWSVLLLVPDLFGGAGRFGSVHFFNSYNLAEVTGYVGLLPLGAALALLVRSFGRRRAAVASDWGMWLALGALGLLLAWGSFSPLGHIWAGIPLFGKTRLQSRNLEILDLALAVVFAFWADRALSARHRSWSCRDWRARIAAVPAAAAILVCAATLAAPGPIEQSLLATKEGATLARGLWPWFVAQGIVAAGVIALVVGWSRLAMHMRRIALVAVVVADLAFFVFATSTAIAPPAATVEPTHAAAAAVLGKGRFAVVDTTATHVLTLTAIGQPDLNAFTLLPSVQGYGSIVSNTYGTPTGSHALDTLDPCALETGKFGVLRLSTLVASPADLVGAPGQPPGRVRGQPATCPTAPHPGGVDRRVFYLGWPVPLRAATLVSTAATEGAGAPSDAAGAPSDAAGAPSDAAHGAPTVGLITSGGNVRWPAETVRRTSMGWSVSFGSKETGVGIVVRGPAMQIADSSTLQGATGGRWSLDGPFQNALDTSSWRYAGTLADRFGVFRRTAAPRPPVWLAGAARGSTVRQLSAPDWGGATDRVVANRAVTVVWSESYLQGWHAALAPVGGGPTRQVTVHSRGLIQAVRVPPGKWILTFQYRPRLLTFGIAGSATALAGFVALFCVTIATRRRRRRRA